MTKKYRLYFYVTAPDLTLWAEKQLLLTFTRHFGCTQRKEMLVELVEHHSAIEQAGLVIAVVIQSLPEMITLFAQRFTPR